MTSRSNPHRSPLFRMITIAASGLGSFVISAWGLRFGLEDGVAGLPVEALTGAIAALCALAASFSAMSFFAGVDESRSYVYRETHFDKLTGLPARIAMIGKIAEASARVLRTGQPVFLIDIDIDRFKQINDSIGYGQGDALICAIAERLVAALPGDVVIGRIGAGEFAVLYPDRPSLVSIESEVERLVESLGQPYQLAAHLQTINLSAGIVAMPKDGSDPVTVLRRSNLALQHARGAGVGSVAVFHPDMGRVADHRRWIEAELNPALDRGDFILHYQPQHDLGTGRVVGYEALIRWKHAERGMIPPAEFISVAEETGMIVPIGCWVLNKACVDAARLPDDCFVAVNISPVQFMAKDFVGTVLSAIARSGISPQRLELEVTETAMMQDRERAADILRQLADLGISVAVDDFGTGYSNLSYLIDFPFRKLKIDRSFVSRIDSDSSTGAVVSTIVGLSRALGVTTIAEGVETEAQATLLRAAGCQEVQGYLFGRPAPLAAAEAVQAPQPQFATMH